MSLQEVHVHRPPSPKSENLDMSHAHLEALRSSLQEEIGLCGQTVEKLGVEIYDFKAAIEESLDTCLAKVNDLDARVSNLEELKLNQDSNRSTQDLIEGLR